ncbi:hypothetical protein JCM5296_005421 [Sporobolomyces johnsonii]
MSFSTPRISVPWPHPRVPYLPSPTLWSWRESPTESRSVDIISVECVQWGVTCWICTFLIRDTGAGESALTAGVEVRGVGWRLKDAVAHATRKAECVIKGGQKPEITE